MKVERIAVIGSGIMGRGIAHVGALAGYQMIIQDISNEALDKAMLTISSDLAKGVKLGKIDQEQANAAIKNISVFTAMEDAVKEADLVIEAVPEDMQIKLRVFAALDEFAPDNAILATNTSTMSPTEIGAITKRPKQVIAMHFFNPVHKMKLLEIVRGLETSDETCEVAKTVGRVMGKETILINEFPGFATSRISALVGNEGFWMLQEGVGSARDIDLAVKLGLNYPMGPFELGDLVGLDVRLKNLEYLHKTLGEKFRPCPLLVKYVKAGRLGRKTGQGVYDYTEGE